MRQEIYMAREIETKCIHLEEEENSINHYGAISYPIYQSATYAHPGVGQSTGYDYSRLQNPTREHLEKTVASLENGIDALAFSSGMAAITLMMELFKPGDHLIVDADLYGGSIRLFNHVSEKNGIEFSSVDCHKENVAAYIRENTKAVYIETPTNPMMNVTDIKALAEITKKHNILLIVDNTFLSPYFQNPLDLGADIVVHSGTKYLGGHNDTLAGFLVTNREDISERFRFLIKTTGAGLAPFDCFLIQRGIKTLGVRMDRAQENAIEIASEVDEQQIDDKALKAYFEQKMLIVNSYEPMHRITLYTIDGRTIYQKQGKTTEAKIDTQSYSGEIFILSVQIESGKYYHLKLGRVN